MKKEPRIQSRLYRKFSSGTKIIKIHLANFRYNHKDAYEPKDIYIDRDILEQRLRDWLNTGEYGSYLVAGYRGMGKSSLVNHIVENIARDNDAKTERCYRFSLFALFAALYCVINRSQFAMFFGFVFLILGIIVVLNYYSPIREFRRTIGKYQHSSESERLKLEKFLSHQDRRRQCYQKIKIKINLGKEVMNERDVLCLIANNIRIKYEAYLRTGQNKPIWMYLWFTINIISTYFLYGQVLIPLAQRTIIGSLYYSDSWIFSMLNQFMFLLENPQLHTPPALCLRLACLLGCFLIVRQIWIQIFALFDKSNKCLKRLRELSERLSSSISESDRQAVMTGGLLNISLFGRRRNKESQIANVRDIESELTEIINTLNSEQCIRPNRVQFIIVLDELDKADSSSDKQSHDDSKSEASSSELIPPDFMSVANGFSDKVNNSERRRTILQLLANMKLFLTSAKAKFVFISGRELYEAFLADLSDREYAISSIFSGVINVSSFLQPQREQSDISSMTEQYVSEILLPREYLQKKAEYNALKNKVYKREIPSLRWYTQYLTECAEKELKNKPEELEARKTEIRHVIMFLHCFIVYLSHVSNGSPKKIAMYFEKYVRCRKDSLPLTEWDDILEYGEPNSSYVLHFTPHSQHKIGFIFHMASPIMDAIINNVSNYDDKLLTSASFLLDHIFKFHGRGFSWRNIEQTPELLDVNKTSELRDFITSIMEYMQQLHISPITVGLFQFKFRKRISEEISYISRISDEASAIFNFTLNEMHIIKQYNFKLLNYYMALSKSAETDSARQIYDEIIANEHFTIADLYFQEEDYPRAMQEYRSVLSYLDRIRAANKNREESTSSTVLRINCMLKLGLTCEYCQTYEMAYVTYCSLVDEMITIREVPEDELGLDIIERRKKDWRIKQPMIVDIGVRKKDDDARRTALGDIDDGRKRQSYRKHVLNGLVWEDGREKSRYANAEYSLDSDNFVSGLSKNLSPAKSRIITKLSMFEDVRLIYKAILAKLFILEKMNMNGITKSNLEVAEAEFKYLHSTINIEEKYLISADFFNQMGKILYYKNNISLLPSTEIAADEDQMQETLYKALYWYDIDILSYIDDFCFKECGPDSDAVETKECIEKFIGSVKIHNIIDLLKHEHSSSKIKWEKWIEKLKTINKKDIIEKYIDYIDAIHNNTSAHLLNAIQECSISRRDSKAKECNLPCHACRYYRRSLRILINEMFVHSNHDRIKKYIDNHMEIYLLHHSFGKYLRNTRGNHLKLLATCATNMGDIMISCIADKRMTPEVLDIVRDLLDDHLYRDTDIGRDQKKEQRASELAPLAHKLTKIDRAILYYLAAFRFCKIAQLPKDAADCLFRIMRVIDDVTTIVNFDKKSGAAKEVENILDCLDILMGNDLHDYDTSPKRNLLEVLFSRFVKQVNAQYGYSAISEMHDFKWIFHMNSKEDLDMTRLQTYSELKEPIWLIANTRIKLLNIRMYHSRKHPYSKYAKPLDDIRKQRSNEIKLAYKHFQPIGHINETFYSQITSYYARFRLNKWILKDMFGQDPMVDRNNSHRYNNDFNLTFLQCLSAYLTDTLSENSLCKEIFSIEDEPKDKLRLLEFILEDSIVCLTEIIYILTPYNHISSFPNSFVAGIYEQLWEWAEMYESLIQVYDFKDLSGSNDIDGIFRLWSEAGYHKSEELRNEIFKCCMLVDEDSTLRERYGSLSSRFFMRLRHQIDDKTLQHVMSNYATEMALRYYTLAESSHSEGKAYQNHIHRNYILNDDLENDTWLFNTALDRFRMHSEYIQNHRRRLVHLYHSSRLYKYDSYIKGNIREREFADIFDHARFKDSLYTNTELL